MYMKSITMITTLAAAVILTASIPTLRAAELVPATPVTPEVQKKATETRKALTPEEKDARKKAQQAKMEERLAQLEKKKAAGTLTATEEKQLQRLTQLKANGWKPPTPPKPTVKTPEKTDK
jgi:hypothetical protein